jgi:hypothetical protein
VKRRSLLSLFTAGLSGLPFARGVAGGQSTLGAPGETTLEALASVVLPSELGRAGRAEVLSSFRSWLKGYQPGAELDHGYGHTRLQNSGPDPAVRYEAQLVALDRAARGEGKGLAELPAERQRALVADALTAAGIDELPERPDGRHVAADLMAFFFRGSAANDLCYEARIGRDECRGLPGSEEAPERLRRDR